MSVEELVEERVKPGVRNWGLSGVVNGREGNALIALYTHCGGCAVSPKVGGVGL